MSEPSSWLHGSPAPSLRYRIASIALGMAVFSGIMSLWLSRVDGWDQRNYHLYNGWAFWHERLGVDLAPAQQQSYFIPWLDAAYWGLMQISPTLTGFVLGFWHGICFALITAIAWIVLRGDTRRSWLAPLLALAGLFSSVFLYELGDTSGDNTTAPFVLGALWCALLADQSGKRRFLLFAGIMLGLAAALKMTNSIYAVGLTVALLSGTGALALRLRNAMLLGVVTALVFVAVAGPWFWLVWSEFGNPIYPKFNTFFDAKMAGEVPILTTTKLPRSWWEVPVFPLLITLNPKRINGLSQLSWGLAWLTGIVALLAVGWRKLINAKRFGPAGGVAPAVRMLWFFVGFSFLAWMARFGVHRYLVVAELLVPLSLWLLVVQVFPRRFADYVAALVVLACVAGAVWGWKIPWNRGWLNSQIVVDVPEIPEVAKATVLLVGGGPQAWRVPFFPAQAVYVGVATNFSASPEYLQRVHDIATARGGNVFAMFPAAPSKQVMRANRLNRSAWRQGYEACDGLRAHANKNKRQLAYVASSESMPCHLQVIGKEKARVLEFNRARQETIADTLSAAGWELQRETCAVYASRIGDGEYPYQWCQVRRAYSGSGDGG